MFLRQNRENLATRKHPILRYSFGTVDFGLIMHIFLKAGVRGGVGKGCDGKDRKVWVSHDNDKESLTPSLLLDKKTCQIFCFTVSPSDIVWQTDHGLSLQETSYMERGQSWYSSSLQEPCLGSLAGSRGKLHQQFHLEIMSARNEPPHDKTNKMAYAPSEDSDQLGHLPSLIWVFTVLMKKAWVLSYPLSAQWGLWSDWADAQADLSHRWMHRPFCLFWHEAVHLEIMSARN